MTESVRTIGVFHVSLWKHIHAIYVFYGLPATDVKFFI